MTVPVDTDPAQVDKVATLLQLVVRCHDAARRHPCAMIFADPARPAPERRFWLAARVTRNVAVLTPGRGQHVPYKGRQAASLTRFSPCIWVHIP